MNKMLLVGRNVFCLLLLQSVLVSGMVTRDIEFKPLSAEEVIESWLKMNEKVKSVFEYGLRVTVPKVRNSLSTSNVTEQCKMEIGQLIEGLRNFKPWALRFLDSSGKMIDGVMTGTLSAIGVYDECLDTVVVSEDDETRGSTLFKGQYCMIDFKPAMPSENEYLKLQRIVKNMNFSSEAEYLRDLPEYVPYFHIMSARLGLCVPSGCTLKDMDEVGTLMGDSFSVIAKIKSCKIKEIPQLSPPGYFAMSCYIAAIFLLIAASLLDVCSIYTKVVYTNRLIRILLVFSLISNFKKLVSTESRSQELSSLNGVRFLGISWIILGHSYFLLNFQMVAGLSRAKDIIGNFAFQAIVNGTYAVDTFFLMGGLLSAYLMIKRVKMEGHPLSIPLYIVHRILRIMPTYIFVLLLTFTSSVSEMGPLYDDHLEEHVQGCYNGWWKNLLFINNFFKYEDMCLRHSWYIACDFQLYIIALLILVPFTKSSKVGISLSIFGVLISVVYSGVISYVNNYPPVILLFESLSQVGDYWILYYSSPLVHMGPYCIGILTGYILASKPKLRIPSKFQVAGWCLAITCNMAVIYGTVNWNRGEKSSLLENVSYAAFSRTGWAMGVAWMIVCCGTGHGGIINYILSSPVLIPLGRLTFCAYLIHPVIQMFLLGNLSMLIPLSHPLMVWLYFGHLCLTFAAAFAGTLLIEAPFLSLEKVILSKSNEASNDKTSPTEKELNAKNLAFNEVLSAQELYKNCTVIENKDFISKL